ncbi:hypothetical protein FA13DRAFT_1638791 [Coprinellus micaceus]|uniref:Uncharacterized protein n=1 Tax=Coprinellus micaceus TaxID=71717 RepID=A0A4Y7SR74_COPMI|nr:hypothetical protein FA13DRAFT_1638791 [Coprinellus micaceus]
MGISQNINGELYYSPNALAIAPLDFNVSPSQNPFLRENERDPRITYPDLLSPRWWSMPFGWTSFIPTKLWLRGGAGSVLMELATRPQIQEFTSEDGEVHGYGISPSCTWQSLEQTVYAAVVALKNKFHIPCILPALPHTFGYLNKYTSRSALECKITVSREWFFVWLGALGYLLAWIHNPSDSAVRIHSSYPEWREVLEAVGISSSWIDDVFHSPVCKYLIGNQRAGCIVNVLRPTPGQPSIKWFVAHGIPVWYRWGAGEIERAEEDEEFRTMAPPPGMRMHHVERRIRSRWNLLKMCSQPRPTLHGSRSGWRFFERRAEINVRLLAKETAKSKATRENRSREPPTSSARVFVWERSDDPSMLYERVPVVARFRAETLGTYGIAQKRYDAISNEWDCCDEFGQAGEDEDSDGWDEAEAGEVLSDEKAAKLTVEVSGPIATDAPSLVELDDRPGEMVDQTMNSALASALQDHLHIHCGFCPPIPGTLTMASSTQFTRQSQRLVFEMGNIALERRPDHGDDYLKSPMFCALHTFFHSIANRLDPAGGTWDIVDACPQFVGVSNRHRGINVVQVPSPRDSDADIKECFRSGSHHYYLISSHTGERWTVAALSASAALLTCRLPQEYTAYDIAYYFAQRGIPFRIFYPHKILVPRHPHIPIQHVIPARPHTHTFTKADYEAYIRMRTMLLGQSHMQGALKRGGIVWRLAIGTLGLNGVVQRPSLYNEFQEINMSREALVEDVLTETELDLLCGSYECFFPNGKDRALKSWWPLVRLFEKEECGYNPGFWSEANETWYARRLQQIEEGKATPHTYTEWKSLLHGSKQTRSFLAYLEKRSQDVLHV